nr:general transcription factor II-I repeat domain-containing protein 2-like [Anolis sagrei ordinatus]
MVTIADELFPESKDGFAKLHLSCSAVARHVELIDEDVTNQLRKKAESFQFYSLALSESTDLVGAAQLLIFVRGINDDFEITEEFLAMEPLMEDTQEQDLFGSVSGVIERLKLPWCKLISVATDGSPNWTGNAGLLKRIQEKVKEESLRQDVIFLHCIIHPQALCQSILQLGHVTNVVIELVYCIRTQGLNHHLPFTQLLEETDHQDFLDYFSVRWESLAKVCQQVWELKAEIRTFLETIEKADDFLQLSDADWICDFAFAVDILAHVNDLSVKLQGKGTFAYDIYTHVTAFKSKLALLSTQVLDRSLNHFPTLATLDVDTQHLQKYSQLLDDLLGEFSHRFSDFDKIEKLLQVMSVPLSQDPETVPVELQFELIDFQYDYGLKEKFGSLKPNKFYASLSEASFPNLRKMAQRMLVLFGSTYICEQTLRAMNVNKAHHRGQLNEGHLKSVLRIATTTLKPDFDALARKE